MAFKDTYRRQVQLLVRVLPYVAQEQCFALKGGTAINLFIRNMPRLSVDIDLTYLPDADRDTALVEIENALRRIAERAKKVDSTIQVTESSPGSQETISKLILRTKDQVQIKIEVTPVLRGCVYEPEMMRISKKAENEFGFAEIKVLSFADLYAGKIMAALDRQHPRDFYDVHELLMNEGISDELRKAVIVYLISHDHPAHTLMAPSRKDISHEFATNFVGMTEDSVSLEMLLDAREKLVANLIDNMPKNHKEFLVSFYSRKPDWNLLGLENAEQLPAVRWREINLDRAGEETRNELISKLEAVFNQ